MKGLDHFLAKKIIARDARVLSDKFEKVIRHSALEMNKLSSLSLKEMTACSFLQRYV